MICSTQLLIRFKIPARQMQLNNLNLIISLKIMITQDCNESEYICLTTFFHNRSLIGRKYKKCKLTGYRYTDKIQPISYSFL